MDSTSLILVLALAGAAWYFLSGQTTAAVTSKAPGTSDTGTAGGGTSSGPTPVTPATVPTTTASILASIAGNGPGISYSLDAWAGQLKTALLFQNAVAPTWYPPGCAVLAPSLCGQTFSLAEYMAIVTPWLQSSGITATFGGSMVNSSAGPVWVPDAGTAAYMNAVTGVSGLGRVRSWAV